MLFKTDLFDAVWDTWMYYHEGVYYLYYLITENSPGEGFGVASSKDGVHFEDHGLALSASDQMVEYLGTGAVWKSTDFDTSKKFICNYSEWRDTGHGLRQNILFAESYDLIHWNKLDEDLMFSPDSRYYEDIGGRWDCIYPLEKKDGGYYGYYTASPIGRAGVGLGESEDGIHWRALPSPEMDLGLLSPVPGVEAGAAIRHKDKIYLMVGSYGHDSSMCFYTANSPAGPFVPMAKNAELFHTVNIRENGSVIHWGHNHAYFSRFFYDNADLLVNFHVLSKKYNQYGRPYTYLAPIKKAIVDPEGILRLMWWDKNNVLIGDKTDSPNHAWIAELDYACGDTVTMQDGDQKLMFTLDQKGYFRLWKETGIEMEHHRDTDFAKKIRLRILVRGEFMEIYANQEYIGVYTADTSFDPVIESAEKATIYQMNL